VSTKSILVQGGDGTAIPSNMVGGTQINSDITQASTVATWVKAATDFGVPPAGNYLMILELSAPNVAGLTGISCVANETVGNVSPVVLNVSTSASAIIGTRVVNIIPYTTDGTKTLYLWVYSEGAVVNITGGLKLIRIS
jgi:hypothetical protein